MKSADLVGAVWIKAEASNAQGNCVMVAHLPDGGVALCDDKDEGTGPALVFTAAEWDAFSDGMSKGEFDRP